MHVVSILYMSENIHYHIHIGTNTYILIGRHQVKSYVTLYLIQFMAILKLRLMTKKWCFEFPAKCKQFVFWIGNTKKNVANLEFPYGVCNKIFFCIISVISICINRVLIKRPKISSKGSKIIDSTVSFWSSSSISSAFSWWSSWTSSWPS